MREPGWSSRHDKRNWDMMTKRKITAEGAALRRRTGSADMLGANSEIGRKLKQYFDELVSDEALP